MPRLPIALLIFLILFNLLNVAAQPPNQPTVPKIHIDVLEGNGQLVNIKSRVNPSPVVQVVDDANKPIQGALVVFTLPSQGPGGTFVTGARTMTANTDRNGRATASGIIPNNQTGQYEIHTSASYQGQSTTAEISQTNVSGVSASSTGGGISKKGLIILAAIAGGVVGGVIAARGGGSSSSSSGPPVITITPGTPSVGGPK